MCLLGSRPVRLPDGHCGDQHLGRCLGLARCGRAMHLFHSENKPLRTGDWPAEARRRRDVNRCSRFCKGLFADCQGYRALSAFLRARQAGASVSAQQRDRVMSTMRPHHTLFSTDRAPLPGAPAGARAGLRKLVELFVVWHMRAATRRQLWALSDLDDHMLKDIGLTRGELRCAARRPFWLASGPATPLPCSAPTALPCGAPTALPCGAPTR